MYTCVLRVCVCVWFLVCVCVISSVRVCCVRVWFLVCVCIVCACVCVCACACACACNSGENCPGGISSAVAVVRVGSAVAVCVWVCVCVRACVCGGLVVRTSVLGH